MVRKTKKKISALVLTLIVVVLSVFPEVRDVLALESGCPWYIRLGYPLAHANIFHALANCWCLLSLFFNYELSWKKLMVSYIIAVSVPSVLLAGSKVVGASGLCFSLMGMVAFRVNRKLYFQCWVIAFLVSGFLFSMVAVWVHVYCYLAGMVVGLFITPLNLIRGTSHGTC